jgi:peptide/nickel transport system permease protein
LTDRAIEAAWTNAPAERNAAAQQILLVPVRRSIALWLGVLILAPVVLAASTPGLIAPYDPFANVGPALIPPSLRHLFGTDDLGRDLFSGVVRGAGTSLMVGTFSATIAVAIGLAVGVLAGFFGGMVDNALMRFADIVQVLPRFFIALLVLTLFGTSTLNICLVLGLFSWPGLARLTRAETLSHREREYVTAALAMGGSSLWIMRRHILPLVRRPTIALLAPITTSAILAEAGLSYLGLADPNWMSWGKLIQNGQAFFNHGWWLSLFPGLAVVVTCVGIALVVEGLHRD